MHAMFALNGFTGIIAENFDKNLCLLMEILNFRLAQKNPITFVEVHPKTIHAMFALNWLTGFRGEFLLTFSHMVLC